MSRRSLRKRPWHGSVSQRSGSPDLDPYKNVTDPEHCPTPLFSFLRWGEEPFSLFAPLLSIIHILHDKPPTSQCTVKHNFVMMSSPQAGNLCDPLPSLFGKLWWFCHNKKSQEWWRNFVTFTNKNASLRPRHRPCRNGNQKDSWKSVTF